MCELPLGVDDLDLLDRIQDGLDAREFEEGEFVSNSASDGQKGKPCGDSFIDAGETCHVGGGEYTSKQQALDKEVAKYLGKSVEKDVVPEQQGYIDPDKGMAAAVKRLAGLKNEHDFKSRIRIYGHAMEDSPEVAHAIASEDWPKHGVLGEMVSYLKNGGTHSFLTVGKYVVDPYLRSLGVDIDDINKFGRRLAGLYDKLGIKPQKISTEPPVAPEPPPKKSSSKGKASTADILGGGGPKPKDATEEGDYGFADSEGSKSLWDWKSDKSYTPPAKWKSAGAIVFRDDGKIAIRKVKGGFGGYDWSWSKGKIDDGETDEQAAAREVLEESGHKGEIVGDLGHHEGTSSTTHFYLMRHTGDDPAKMDKETEKVEWVTPSEAADKLNNVRDLKVLIRAMEEMKKHIKP